MYCYSAVKKVNLSHSDALARLTPNLQQNRKIDLSLQLVQSEKVKIELFKTDRREAVMLLHEGTVNAGNHQIVLPSDELQSGNFMVRIEGVSFQQNMQLIML